MILFLLYFCIWISEYLINIIKLGILCEGIRQFNESVVAGIIFGCLHTVHHSDFYLCWSIGDITQVLFFQKNSHLPLNGDITPPTHP